MKIWNVFNSLTLKQIFWKTKTFFKKPEYCFLAESTTTEDASFPYKTAISEANVKANKMVTTKWTKNGVFSVTNLFFWKLCFSLRTSCKELIRCTNNPNAYICTLYKCWSFTWRCFSPVSILKLTIFFRPKFPKNRITIRKWKNRTCACVHGRYLLYQTFPNEGRETQRYFNVSSPFSRKDNNTFWCEIISRKSKMRAGYPDRSIK